MSTTYSKCSTDVLSLAKKLIQTNHPDVLSAKVTITYLFAANAEGDAITHGGYPAIGLFKINNLRDRVAGLNDATILLDEDWWHGATDAQCSAVLDHELHHCEVRYDQSGAVKTDDAGRPKLRCRKHDIFVGGFIEIARRHGGAAVEVEAIEKTHQTFVQMELRFDEVA